MTEITEEELEAWEQDIIYLVNTLKESFESSDARYSVDELNAILYVELEGLNDYSEEEIAEIAGPVLEVCELEFEDVVLVPYS